MLSLIDDHGMQTLRELMVTRGITHGTAFKHLTQLVELGQVSEAQMLHLYELDSRELDSGDGVAAAGAATPGGRDAGATAQLDRDRLSVCDVQRALERARPRRGSGVRHDDAALTALGLAHPRAVAAQEAKQAGLTSYQLTLVKWLLRRRAALAAGASGPGPERSSGGGDGDGDGGDSAVAMRLLSKTHHARVAAYLGGASVDEIRQPPYSRAPGVSAHAALQSLVMAIKAGVAMPIPRLLADFHLDADPMWLSSTEVASALGRALHLRAHQTGIVFYTAAQNILAHAPATAAKLEAQADATAAIGGDLGLLQVRLVYYLVVAGALDAPSEWLVAEEGPETAPPPPWPQ